MYLEALTFHRAGRALKRMRIPLLPRMCEGLIFFFFNSVIPLETEIGPESRCGHRGIAVVIHSKARIGARCVIRAQVTIGGARPNEGREGGLPVIGDDVSLGTGAKVLGPVTIGDNAVIGANAVVIHDVPAGATVGGVPARVLKPGSGSEIRSGAAPDS